MQKDNDQYVKFIEDITAENKKKDKSVGKPSFEEFRRDMISLNEAYVDSLSPEKVTFETNQTKNDSNFRIMAGFNVFFENLNKKCFNNPFDFLKKINSIGEQRVIIERVLKIATKGNPDGYENKQFVNQMKSYYEDNTKSLSQIFDEINALFNSQPNKDELFARLNASVGNVAFLMVNQCLDKNAAKIILDAFSDTPGVEEYVPSRLQYSSAFEYAYDSDNHPYEEKLNELKKTLPEDDPQIEVLNYANKVLINGKSEFTGVTLNVAESAGQLYDEKVRVVGVAEKGKEMLGDVIDKGRRICSLSDKMPVQDKLKNMAKLRVKNTNNKFSEDYKKFLIDIKNEIIESGIYDPKEYEAESGKKIYSFSRLVKLADELKKAVDEKDMPKITELTMKYRALENKYDSLIEKLKNVDKEESITSNISSSRESKVPAKYRIDYVGASRLTGIWQSIGFFDKLGISLEEFLNDPETAITKGITNLTYTSATTKFFSESENMAETLSKLTDYNFTTMLFNKFTDTFMGIDRAYDGITVMSGADKLNVQTDAMLLLGNYSSDITSISGNVVAQIHEEKCGQFIANALVMKKDDFNPFLHGVNSTNFINPATRNQIEIFDLAKYIDENYTAKELLTKLDSIFSDINKCAEKDFVKTGLEYIEKAINKTQNLSVDEKKTLADYVKTGAISDDKRCALDNYFSVMARDSETGLYLNVLTNHTVFPSNFNFINSYLELENKKKELMKVSDVDVVKKINARNEIVVIQAKQDHYEKVVRDLMNDSGIDTSDEKEFINVINSMLRGDEKFASFRIGYQNLFDDLAHEAEDNINHHYAKEVLSKMKDIIVTNEDIKKATYIYDNYCGIKQEYTSSLKDNESYVGKAEVNLGVKMVERLEVTDPETAKSFTKGVETATYETFTNYKTNEKLIKEVDEFKVSDKTREGIITVYRKMKDLGMLIDFNPQGEEPTKLYAFHKLANAHNNIENALNEKKLDEAYNLTKERQKIIGEYKELFDLVEKTFPQDGMHCSGNLCASREQYIPYSLSSRTQPQIQASAIYLIASMCNKYNFDFEEFMENPSKGLKEIAEITKKAALDEYSPNEEKSKGAMLGELLGSPDMSVSYVVGRGIEGLLTLESDNELRDKNAVIGAAFAQINDASTTIKGFPFVINKGKITDYPKEGRYEIDYNSLKGYIAAGDKYPVSEFIHQMIDPTTGAPYKKDFNYSEFVKNDQRSISEILKDVAKTCADTIYDYNLGVDTYKYNKNEIVTGANVYAAAAAYVADVIKERKLESDKSVEVRSALNFISNPSSLIRNLLRSEYDLTKIDDFFMYDAKLIANINSLGQTFDQLPLGNADNYYQHIKNQSIDMLEREFNTRKAQGASPVNEDNLLKMLSLAKVAKDKYDERSTLNQIFSPSAHSEKNLYGKIEKEVLKLGVTKEMLDNLYNKLNNIPNEIASVYGNALKNISLNTLKADAIKDKLNKIFDKGSIDDLTPEQKNAYNKSLKNPNSLNEDERGELEQAKKILAGNTLNPQSLKNISDLTKDIKDKVSVLMLDAEEKKLVDASLKLIDQELTSKGLGFDFRTIVMDNGISLEKATQILAPANQQPAVERIVIQEANIDNDNVIAQEGNGAALENALENDVQNKDNAENALE